MRCPITPAGGSVLLHGKGRIEALPPWSRDTNTPVISAQSNLDSSLESTQFHSAATEATFSDGRSQYGCRVFDRCTIDLIKQEIKTENLELRCCQSRLCNGSFMASPSAVLILSLAAALLLLSW
ncbi:hypothetical protein GDO78_022897 [Eleutherodactylus coqui]|uniref:UPAR/Ly6 domain-containing protein n=1 Tax=Eleutherodactylus coqui TaxID=57060 RepID=A0A8J6EQB4_ELECQ|nr:hypothetical protein GDO78_022897 [Eleutherodactylus coqui]KAG9473187.1 hypothetical protein GDO78_022897 [Eleutherodactylus coqui]